MIESTLGENVGGHTLAKIGAVLGVTTDWLITGEGREPSPSRVRAAVQAAQAARAGKAA
jgi:hypothetical protein